ALSLPATADDSFVTYLYFSGTTFFTLGYGDVVPTGTWGRLLSVVEAGIGFGFLAVVISYLPVLYQAFSRREITISLLDARAGSPPSAGELLRRLAVGRGVAGANVAGAGPFLVEWERWAAELLESHLSYPFLCYYRSQHDNQSWVGARAVRAVRERIGEPFLVDAAGGAARKTAGGQLANVGVDGAIAGAERPGRRHRGGPF